MNNEKIKLRITESGQTIEVVVFSKRAEAIEVVPCTSAWSKLRQLSDLR